MKKEELENLKTQLENGDLSQLDFPEIKRIHSELNLEGIDLSQLDLPSIEKKKTNIDSYTPTTNTGIIRTSVDLYSSPQVLSTDEESKEDIDRGLTR
jgi:hypothetical protein